MADDHYPWKLSRRADRDLAALPEGVAAAAVDFIAGPIVGNPYRLGGPLHDELEGYLSARLGKFYRVVYRVDERARMVEVVRVRSPTATTQRVIFYDELRIADGSGVKPGDVV